jgi:hypothetical protein
MEYLPLRISDIIRETNRSLFLPAIQREFVWNTDRIEKLFDSIMSDFPVGGFLFWRLEFQSRDKWPVYEFLRSYSDDSTHNQEANLSGITRDLSLVLDGQQRITSLNIGLKGSYKFFYYRWRTTYLYLNLLKTPLPNEEDPEELTFEFKFREDDSPDEGKEQLWYKVSRVLDTPSDAEDAKQAIASELKNLNPDQRDNAYRLIGRLYSRIFALPVANYYEERSQDLDKVLQVFVRANSGGQPLEYSDLLLSTATAKWEKYDAREEIHDFTDAINKIGSGYNFGKDFVLKSCLYLTPPLPIQYRVKNFTKTNLAAIEAQWPVIKSAVDATIRLMAKFGFDNKNIVAPLALLPIALFIERRGNFSLDTSSDTNDAKVQDAIRKWFIFSTLKNAFGGSSDTTLTRLRNILLEVDAKDDFPVEALYASLAIEPNFSDAEIQRVLGYQYQGRYTNLALSLLYPDLEWKNTTLHQDHIWPKSEFDKRLLKKRGYNDSRIEFYVANYNNLANLEFLSQSENVSKNASMFDSWLKTRDSTFCSRHSIPVNRTYSFDDFEDFIRDRAALLAIALRCHE